MKKNMISILSLLCALVSLVLSGICFLAAREEPTYYSDRLFELNQENQALEEKIAQLEEQIGALEDQLRVSLASNGLSGWTLSVLPWQDYTGATVSLAATPAAFREGMSASLLVTLDDREIETVPCYWDGAAFTAAAELSAADGYGYYCLLRPAEGDTLRIPLTTPENCVQDIPVYLEASLSLFCNLTISAWEESDGQLVLTDAYAYVQLPRVSEGELTMESAELVLRLNGQELQRLPISPESVETAGGYEALLEGFVLPLPQLSEEDLLELALEVALSDGRQLTAYGANWYRSGGELHALVG